MPEEGADGGSDARDRASVEALDGGGLPVTARKRIAEAEATGGTWGSDLSVAELAAVRAVGFDPVGLVMGSCVYQIGYQWGANAMSQSGGGGSWYSEQFPCIHGWGHEGSRSGYNWEHRVFENGIVQARNLAMTRLSAEATALGAHGVVGLRVRFDRPQGVAGQVEFVAIGTAVRRRGAPAIASPFTCHLSGQDFAKLLRSGYVPAAYVIGVGAVEVDAGCVMEYQERSYVNQEIYQPSIAIQRCREIAVSHLEHEAALVGEGVVGVDVSFEHHSLGYAAELFELQATGTAVRRFADVPPRDAPLAILRLGGGS
jgi:uncharacterized protein YbjQ (UPF0145 family)